MNSTHCFVNKRDLSQEDWDEYFIPGAKFLISSASKEHGVAVVNSLGDAGTKPEISSDFIAFNGVARRFAGDAFIIKRKKSGLYFCNTESKPYDIIAGSVAMLAFKLFEPWLIWDCDAEVDNPAFTNRYLRVLKDTFGIKSISGHFGNKLRIKIESIAVTQRKLKTVIG